MNPRIAKKIGSILSGNVFLKVYPDNAATSAAALNAAEAGSFKKKLRIQLEDNEGRLLNLLGGFDVAVSVSENVANPIVSAPTVSDSSPLVKDGIATVELTYDTGTGKTYAAGDSISATVSPASGTVLADAYGVGPATFTDTIGA